LNYQAYANRAIVANEVMIAQSLTALAWVQQANTLTRQASVVASFIPGLQTFAQWASQAAQIAAITTHAAAAAEVPFRSAYTRALQASQEAMHLAVNPFNTQTLINEIVWSGDKRFFGQYLPTADVSRFYRSVKTYGGNERRLLAEHVTSALDRFSRDRSFDHRLYLLPTFTCIPNSIDRSFSRLVRRGNTRLTSNLDDWHAADTISIHRWSRRSWWNPLCRSHSEVIPLGWGAAATLTASDRLVPAFTNQALASSHVNPRGRQNAQSDSARLMGYLGLSTYRDFTDQTPQGRQAAQYRIPVLVRLPTRNTSASSAVSPEGLLDRPITPGSALWSLSVALTAFEEPQASAGQSVAALPSLFLPYWRAQLTTASGLDQAAALAIAQNRKEP
jgi:hypothetical protein